MEPHNVTPAAIIANDSYSCKFLWRIFLSMKWQPIFHTVVCIWRKSCWIAKYCTFPHCVVLCFLVRMIYVQSSRLQGQRKFALSSSPKFEASHRSLIWKGTTWNGLHSEMKEKNEIEKWVKVDVLWANSDLEGWKMKKKWKYQKLQFLKSPLMVGSISMAS